MPRSLFAFLVLGVCALSAPAAAQDPLDEPATSERAASPGDEAAPAPEKPAPNEPTSEPETKDEPAVEAHASDAAPPPSAEVTPPPAAAAATEKKPGGFETFVSGYFRAPFAMGMSPRPSPDDMDGPELMQISYGPNRTVDSNYYSFAYTRLQEQDWAEVFVHAKRKHVHAVVGWMGYWFQAAGFRNYDASWAPAVAYLTLDTDFSVGGLKPNIALSGGAWWPRFGYFEKYDTFTLGQFRQVGEQLKLTVPVNPKLTMTLVQGFGTGRDGSFNVNSPPPYQAQVGLDLLHYEHLQVTYAKVFDLGLHFNHQWTRDPNLTRSAQAGQAYTQARQAKFTTFGGEASVNVPYAGRLWISPSYTRVRYGWALGSAGTEVMHSLGGAGFAKNYMAWDESPRNSSGTGSSLNLGFLYENKLSTILGQESGKAPEVTLNLFGLFIDSKLDLPSTSLIPQDRIAQLKYGADLSLQALDWLGVMLRWDEVNYDLDHSGYIFSAISPRVTFSSHFLGGESIYLQYSRYRYGDKMVLAGRWPWGMPLVAGNDIIQGGPYAGHKPDMDVIRVQASVAF